MAFKREFILKKRADFQRIQSGSCSKGKYVIICSSPSTESHIRVGFTVTKKIGNAVVRNRCKRRLRELSDLFLRSSIFNSRDYVFIAKRKLYTAHWNELVADISKTIKPFII